MTNREIAQEISNRIGTAPVPFDSVYSIALEIYHQLGGEESQFDSVYSILLEILPLVEGGGSGKAIEEVDALPEASENKDKLFRLDNGDKDVYAAKLLSSETITTNRLPDAQQIDKAYIYRDTGEDIHIWYYSGAWKFILNDGELNGYGWLMINDNQWVIQITDNNAENVSSDTLNLGAAYTDEGIIGIDFINHILTIDGSVDDYNWENSDSLEDVEAIPIPATYNAPESAQIGNATLEDVDNGELAVYTGEQITFTYNNGEIEEEITGYKWEDKVDTRFCMVTSKPASEIYFYYDEDNTNAYYTDTKLWYVELYSLSTQTEDGFYSLNIPQLNAPDSEQVDNAYLEMETHYRGNGKFYYKGEIQIRKYDFETVSSDYVIGHLWETEDKYHHYITLTNAQNVYGGNIGGHFEDEDLQYYGDEIGWVSTTYTVAEIPGLISYYDTNYIISQESSTVKYQRTETIEEWDWEDIVKPAIIDVEDLPETIDNSNKGNIYRIADDATYMAVNYDGVWVWDYITTQKYIDNVIPTINVNADLIYNQDMTINSIDNVEYTTSTGEELPEILLAASINANFNIKVSGMQMGTVYAIGTFSRYFVDMGPVQNNLIRFTLPFMNLANQSQDTLLMELDGNDNTWTVRLQGA